MVALVIPALPSGANEPESAAPVLEEVVVTGHQPGPPLWKVSHGENVLWILPLVDMYPKEMEWDSSRVENLILASQEYIARPVALQGITTLNPFTIVRAMRMSGKAAKSPDGKTLAELLPQDLYQRFSVLKARYLPKDQKIEKQGVTAAGRALQQAVLDQENLAMLQRSRIDSPQPITGKLNRWLKANKGIRRTMPSAYAGQSISSADLKILGRIYEQTATLKSVTAWQVECLEKAVTYFENDLEAVKRRANAWAQGRVDDLVSSTPLYGGSASCRNPPLLPDSVPAIADLRKENPELAAMLTQDRSELEAVARDRWLAAAEAALSRNASTFGVLPVDDILDEGSVVARLREKGYQVEVSAE